MSLYLAFRTGVTLIRPSLNAMVDLSSVSARSAKFHGACARKSRNVRVILSNLYYEEHGACATQACTLRR